MNISSKSELAPLLQIELLAETSLFISHEIKKSSKVNFTSKFSLRLKSTFPDLKKALRD